MASALVENELMGVIFIAGGANALVFGLLDLFTPGLTIRWQVRSTSKARGARRAVGETFQQLFRVDPAAEPWDDSRVRRSVRWIGVGLIVIGGLVIEGGLLLMTRRS